MTDKSNHGRAEESPTTSAVRLPDLNLIRELAWRTGLLGFGLFLVLTDEPQRDLRLNALTYFIAVVWCRYDGFLSGRRWGGALLEAILWYIAAAGFARMLMVLTATLV